MTTLPQGLTVEQWAERLNMRWQTLVADSIHCFVELGRDLIECRDGMPRGEWQQTLKALSFNPNTARSFMRVTKWIDSVGIAHGSLPPDYTTIDKLSRLSEGTFIKLYKDGVVSPTLKRNEVSKILRLERVHADEKRVLELRPRPGKYRTIVIDPAWEYDEFSRGAVADKIGQYAKQTYEQLWELDLRQWAEDECHLYCWATNAYVLKAGALIEHWGFEYKQILTWIKPPPFGLGRNYRNSTEQVLFAMVGDRTTRANNLPTHFEGPRGGHSEKPESFYDIVRLASYPPYCEGNQCKLRPDFTDMFMAGAPLKAAV